MIFRNINREYRYLVVAALVTAAIVVPIIFIGIPDTIDLPQHFRFADAYYSSIINGDWFPGWAGNENFGYGDIGIRFYPPLAYYFLAFGRLLTGNWYDATWFTFVIWMLVGCFGIFYWSRNWFTIKESSIIAVVYVLIPFHLNQLYTGFNQFSEVAATSLLTFCFAFSTRIFTRGKAADVLGLACFYALLILTHLPTSIVGSICLLVYSLTFCKKGNFIRPVAKSAAAVLIAFAASSFYWVRVVTEIKWLNHDSEKYTKGFFDFAGNFFPLSLHITDKPLFNYFILDLIVGFTMISFLFSIVYNWIERNAEKTAHDSESMLKTVLPVGIFAFFMFTPLSTPVWEYITPIQKIQFPLRWMPVAAMCGAIVFGAAFNLAIKQNLIKQKLCFYIFFIYIAAVLLFNFTYVLHPSSYIPLERTKFEAKIENLPTEPSFYCWWTVWAKLPAVKNTSKVQIENRETNVLQWESERKSFEIESGNPANAKIAVFYYPHWKADVNGVEVEISKDENGAIVIPVPEGKSKVELRFEEPKAIVAARIISLASLCVMILSFCFFRFRRKVSLK